MKITLLAADQLTNDHLERWSQLQAANPELQSPFFHPFYTREAAAAFPNVEVAIIEENGEPMGYFPFQRSARNVGFPVGGSLNDFQGVIAGPGFPFDVAAIVRGCRLSGLRFTQLLASQQPFQRYHWLTCDSHSMDLSRGFDVYCEERRSAGSSYLSRIRNQARKAVRDLGPVRFETEATDPRVLSSLLDWKARQYRRIRTFNPLTVAGTLTFFERLLARRESDFRGVLSALYLGDHLVAAHLGMRCRGVLHAWFPTYDEDFGKYSPGLIYFMEQARAAAGWGIHRIDLGGGNEKFKTSLSSCDTRIAEGGMGLGALSTSLQRSWLYTKRWLLSSRFRGPARAVVRGFRGLFLYGLRHDSKS